MGLFYASLFLYFKFLIIKIMICLTIYHLCRFQERRACIQLPQCVHMTLLVQKELFMRSFRITVVCLDRSGKIGAIT